jgi:hypothetical protein
MPEITSAIDFLRKLRVEDFVTIKFLKQDGSIRLMKCSLNFNRIPIEYRPKKVDLAQILKLIDENGILHVFDLEKEAWRSVPFDRVEWMKTSRNVTYFIKVKEGKDKEKEKAKGEK